MTSTASIWTGVLSDDFVFSVWIPNTPSKSLWPILSVFPVVLIFDKLWKFQFPVLFTPPPRGKSFSHSRRIHFSPELVESNPLEPPSPTSWLLLPSLSAVYTSLQLLLLRCVATETQIPLYREILENVCLFCRKCRMDSGCYGA